MVEREQMPYDVVIVGAGPAGLSAAIRLKQLANDQGQELSVCVIEKGSEVGAHIISGALLEPRALNELLPDWQALGAPLHCPVSRDEVVLLTSAQRARRIPNALVPKTMHNQGNFIVSLGNFCRWLAEQAETLGVEIFAGFAAAEVLYHEDGSVKGVATGDMGRDVHGQAKNSYTPGLELHAKYTLFAEGCRGHLGKQLIARFQLDQDSDPQHYGLGLKELWEVDPSKHEQGLVLHGTGWPLNGQASGGFFLYHTDHGQVSLGLIVDLNYANPYLSPYDELQRLKHHPAIRHYLEGGKRVSYGARAIAKGGLNSLPKMTFPGGLLIGCDAGTLNFAKIKGSHTAMKSGMVAAESVFARLQAGCSGGQTLDEFESAFKASWAWDELQRSRNFGPAIHRFGPLLGGAFNFIEQNLFNGRLPLRLRDTQPDHRQLKLASDCARIDYPKPDGVISFDKLSSVFLSNTNHQDDQPCHLVLKQPELPLLQNLPLFAEPAQRYCPAGVYEISEGDEGPEFVINSQNCLHCKTCDIKDPAQNITWVAPEGGGGPNYPNM